MPEKVRVKYKGEFHNIDKSYIEGLKGYERRKQIKSIVEGKDRPKNLKGFENKRSSYVEQFEEKYKTKINDLDFIDKNIIKKEGIDLILTKGRKSYFSGSRPNQNIYSWSNSRLASVIMKGPARKVDKAIWDEYKL